VFDSANKVFANSGANATISESGLVVMQHGKKSSLSLTNIKIDGSGQRTVFAEFKIVNPPGLESESEGSNACIGAVINQPSLDLDKYHAYGQNQGAYFMDLHDGSLCGSGKAGNDAQGEGTITHGDRMGVLVRTGQHGFVKFFRNGAEFGPGFKAGEALQDYNGNVTGRFRGPISGPLVIAVQTRCPSQSFELVQDSPEPDMTTDDLQFPLEV
jgi:hypothetical protein